MTQRHWLYLGVGLPVLLGALDLTVISAVLPVIIADLDLVVPDGVRQASWLVVGYLIAYAVGILGGGPLADRYGSRRVLLWSVVIFGIASFGLIAVSAGPVRLVQQVAYRAFEARPDPAVVTIGVLTGWRVIQALAAGALVPSGMAFGWKRLRTRSWLAWIAAVDLLGWTFGHLYGGVVVRFLDWPAAFWLNVPAAVFAYLVLRRLPADEGSRAPFPIVGFGLVSLGLAGIIIGLGGAESSQLPVRPWYIVVGVGAFLAGWVRSRDLLLPRREMGRHPFTLLANAAIGYLVFLMLAAVPIFVSVLIETDTSQAAWTTGWTLTAFTLPLATAAFLGGRYARLRILIAASVIGLVGIALISQWEPRLSTMLPGLVVAGFGLGWLFAPLAEAPLRNVSDDSAGGMSAAIILLRLIGMAAGSSVLTSFVLAGIADLDVAAGVSAGVLEVFHDVVRIALPAGILLFPALRPIADP